MTEVRQTAEFSDWLRRLKDPNAVARIVARIRRMEMENPGDAKSVGKGVMEMRIDYGPGYRIYYMQRGPTDRDSFCAPVTSALNRAISSALRN